MKDQYIQICQSASVPVFFQPWWLDSVSDSSWKAIVLKNKKDTPIAIMPYYLDKKLFLKLSRQPQLTPYLGMFLFCEEESNEFILSNDNIKLIEKLTSFDHLDYNFHPSFKDWRPFYNLGFSQSLRYTYVLDNHADEDTLWSNLKNTVRTSIRNTQSKLKFKESDDISAHLHMQKSIYARQHMKVPYSLNALSHLYQEIIAHNAGKLFVAADHNDNVQGSILLVWDKFEVYNLMAGQAVDAPSGTIQFLLWNAIRESKKYAPAFNFEGGMLANIEPTFRHFGGRRIPYHRIKWDKNLLIRASRAILGR